jgi:hypothetical protein
MCTALLAAVQLLVVDLFLNNHQWSVLLVIGGHHQASQFFVTVVSYLNE